jgi:uncharacterized membrane protein
MPTSRGDSKTTGERLADFLAFFSLGLGVAQLTVPGMLNALAGIRNDAGSRLWQRIVGVREIGHFASIEANRPRPAAAIWGRVGGDTMDAILLAIAWSRKRDGTARLAATSANIAAIGALDVYTALRLGSEAREAREAEGAERGEAMVGGPLHVRASTTVKKPREEVYGFWHNFENLPTFMGHVESVKRVGDGRSHWKVKAPAGATVEWDAEVTEDRPNSLIAWHSLSGSSVENSGQVRFVDAPGNRGTEVHVEFDYEVPAGRLVELLAKAFGEEPTQQAKDDLRRFKQVMETGVVVRSEGTPEGVHSRRLINQRPAQPLPEGSRP